MDFLMSEEDVEIEDTKLTVVSSTVLETHDYGDRKLEDIISDIVSETILADVRISNTPETREALRDYVRMEIVLAMKFAEAIAHPNDITAADERMIRSAVKMKMDIRIEIYKDVKGKPGKEIEVGQVRELIKSRIVKSQRKVDILE